MNIGTTPSDMLDPITLEVTRNKLESIAEEMQWTLLNTSYSAIVKEGLDASASLFLPDGSTLAQACAIPAHLGILVPSVANILRCFPLETMAEGDIYCMNDPYSGGTHIPDLTLVMPVFYDGQVIALSCCVTHHQDTGGMAPGSVPTNATDIFQEGLRLPALKLVSEGKINQDVVSIIRVNVRLPDTFMGDVNGQISACQIGRRRILELTGRLGGSEKFLRISHALLDHSEYLTRQSLMELRDGTYHARDFLDNDGIDLDTPIEVAVAVTVKSGTLHIDFTGTSKQVKGPINCVPSGSLAAAYYFVRAITDPLIPTNGGCFRPVTLHLPVGSLVNPVSPAAVNARALTMKSLANTMLRAVAEAAPERVPAVNGQNHMITFGGRYPDGPSFVVSEGVAGGMGAHIRGDGVSVCNSDIVNGMNLPIEAMEMDFPIRIEKSELRMDSGGRGKHRGGQGIERVYLALVDGITLTHRGDHHVQAADGVLGGEPGAKARSWIVRASGETVAIKSKIVTTMNAGDRLYLNTPGAGGYGQYSDRDPARIADDVLNGKVSS